MIFQLIDDHSRLAIASLVARSETAQAAVRVVNKGIVAHGVPQRLLSDNGVALNPSRRGHQGQLVAHLRALGTEPITGKPGKPTTQGKNERFHQTLFRWLDKQPLAGSLRELQAQVDLFDHVYNTQRPHQALPERITPQQAWDATPIAEPPISAPGVLHRIRERYAKPARQPSDTLTPPPTEPTPAAATPAAPAATPAAPAAASAAPPSRRELYREATTATGIRTTIVRRNGVVRVRKVEYQLGRRYAGQTAYVLTHPDKVEFYNHQGTQIIEHPWPPPGTTYVPHTTPGLSPMS